MIPLFNRFSSPNGTLKTFRAILRKLSFVNLPSFGICWRALAATLYRRYEIVQLLSIIHIAEREKLSH